MAIKGCKTIAEYAFRRWMERNNFVMQFFELTINKNEGIITDANGETLVLVYDSEAKEVFVKE